VLRFSDIDILKNIDGVIERILEHLKILPSPPLEKEGITIDNKL
jgi:very-short-patch-repair endonuclease